MGVDTSIGKLVNLEILDIGCNPLIGELPYDIGYLENLKNVNLDNIGLSQFPEYITGCRNIERLRLSNNKINEIPDSIEKWVRIKSLNLINCNLRHVTPKIGVLKTLTELFVNNNELFDIPNEIENLANLEYLDLSNNQLQHFPNIFTNMKQLIVLITLLVQMSLPLIRSCTIL
jgi:Leucine-rich repeat (LRR) protein